MLHAKYESSSPYGLGQEDFESFIFRLPLQPEFFTEIISLKFSESASPKDHFSEVSLKSVGFRGQDFLSNCSRTDGHTDGCQTMIDCNSSS